MWCAPGGQIPPFQARKYNILRPERLISQRLIRSQEPQIFSREILRRDAGAVIAMLEHDTDALRRRGELVQQTLL